MFLPLIQYKKQYQQKKGSSLRLQLLDHLQVFGCPKASWENDGVMATGAQLSQVGDVATGDARRLREHIPEAEQGGRKNVGTSPAVNHNNRQYNRIYHLWDCVR